MQEDAECLLGVLGTRVPCYGSRDPCWLGPVSIESYSKIPFVLLAVGMQLHYSVSANFPAVQTIEGISVQLGQLNFQQTGSVLLQVAANGEF